MKNSESRDVIIFIDANVLLDFALKRERYQTAKQIFEYSDTHGLRMITSVAAIQIVAYWLVKSYTIQTAKDVLVAMLDTIQIVESDHVTVVNAIASEINDIEDAVHIFIAVKHSATYFITNDKKILGNPFPIAICTPEYFLNNSLQV